MTFTCRFAPTPNGRLHLGHAFSALVNHRAAVKASGRFLLRMEDIDPTRCRPPFERAIVEDLDWLGILPAGPVRRQSEHLRLYAGALARLEAEGVVYPAFESRGEIARAVADREAATGGTLPRDPDGAPLYPFARAGMSDAERARRRAAGAPFVLRLDMARATALTGPLTWREAQGAPDGPLADVAAAPAHWGDVILGRKDVPTSYHLSVVMDDAAQGITHVIRGADLYHATSVHRVLQALLGLPEPVYHHHRLILDPEGRKLSKSHAATSLATLRASGAGRAEVLRLLGTSPARARAAQATPRM